MSITYTGMELAPANNQLAAYITFDSDSAVSLSYTVIKRATSSTSVDFTYESSALLSTENGKLKIPVIGLYANNINQVRVIFRDSDGQEIYNNIIEVDTQGQTYREATIFHLNIEQTDRNLFSSVWGNSWLMTTNCDGYDRNGDLRCYFSAPYRNQMLRTHNGYFYMGSDEDEHWYGRRFFKIDILGNEILEFILRDSDGNLYANTHDLTWDSAGNLYMVGNDIPDRSTNTMRQDAWILKFNEQTGKMIWAKNYSSAFDGSQILNNSPTNDAHLNSLTWLPSSAKNDEAIITHSRSACVTFGISPETGAILWTINTGGSNLQFPSGVEWSTATKLAMDIGAELENGAHTVFVTNNDLIKANIQLQPGQFVVSLFNNRSCVDSDGVAVVRPITADSSVTPYQTNPACVMFYLVDLNNKLVTRANKTIELPGNKVPQITDFMGAVFEHGEYYSVYTNHARSFFICDIAGNVIASIYDVICSLDGYPEFSGECYRARLFEGDELSSLVNVGVERANA
ncbi:aryl-sulfate sulfotransferase [Lelliottia sp.]|uniref:aryl-sulfate sulfotransferase n=1 Tax=Lelliottia sp. TaxID=1898429 RepID=UPI00388E1BE8